MATLLSICSLVIAGFAICLFAPFLVALLGQNEQMIEGFGLLIVFYILFSTVMLLAYNGRTTSLGRGGMYLLAICCWLTLVAAAIIPFMLLEKQNVASAFFEAVSASTALGSNILPADQISTPMKVFRSITAWYGGFLTLTLIVFVLSPNRVGGLPNKDLRFVLHSSGATGAGLYRTLMSVAVPYFSLTALCFVLLMAQTVRPLEAAMAATAAMSTNGFLPHSISIFDNFAAELTMIIFMIIGGTSIIWHQMLYTRRINLAFSQHRESIGAVLIVLVLGIALALNASLFGDQNFAPIKYIFDVASFITTTGISYGGVLEANVPLLLMFALGIGGATTFSTSGGVKLYRLGIMAAYSLDEARQLVFPNAVLTSRISATTSNSRAIKAAWSFFFIFILTLCIGMLGFAVLGMPFEIALSSSIGAINSVANMVDMNYLRGAENELTSTWAALLSLVGRVEILVVFAVISNFRQS